MGESLLAVVSRKPVPTWLTDHPSVDQLSVLTEPPYVASVPAGAHVETVDSIMDVEQVRRAARRVLQAVPSTAHIVSPAEHGVMPAGFLRSVLGLPGIGFETSLACSNKYLMKRRLRAAGLAVAEARVVDRPEDIPDAAEQMSWPVVVKPTYGGGAVDVFRFDRRAELEAFLASDASQSLRSSPFGVVVERYVRLTDEFHIDGVVHDGAVQFAAVSRYFVPMLGAPSQFSGSAFLPEEHPEQAPLRSLHQQVVRAVGLEAGVTHLEVYGTGDGYVIGEIACRPAGGGIVPAVRRAYGVDLWAAWLETSLGRDPAVTAARPTGILANYDLPVCPGRLTDLVSAEELAALPGVVDVDMLHRLGDVIGPRMHSSSALAVVYVEAPNEDKLDAALAGIRAAFRLTVE